MAAPKTAPSFRTDRLAPLLTSAICILPLLLLSGEFRKLYWFHDDWSLLSEMQGSGMAAWLEGRYGENFAPLFKLLWQGAIRVSGGSYMGMILLLWATHLAVLLLFASVLRRCGFGWKEECLALLTLGLSWTNIETLGWASCWVSQLSVFFLMLAWHFLLRAEESRNRLLSFSIAMLCAAASALSFSRGVFTGVLLGFFLIASSYRSGARSFERMLTVGSLAAITGFALIPYAWMLREYGNFQGLTRERLWAMLSYSGHYLLLNPLYQLLPISHVAPGTAVTLFTGVLKAVVIVTGLLWAKDEQRPLLWTLLLFEAIMAILIGLGRFDTEIATAASSRYQYPALLCFGPFLGIAATEGARKLFSPAWSRAALALFFIAWASVLGIPWARQMPRWADWRGTQVRAALAAAAPDERFGLAAITAGRARELTQSYNLH